MKFKVYDKDGEPKKLHRLSVVPEIHDEKLVPKFQGANIRA